MRSSFASRSGLFLSFIFLFAALPPPTPAQTGNPLTGDLGVHDPMLLKAGSTYYLFHTGNGVSMKTSQDRIAWRNAGKALATPPLWHAETVPGSGAGLWAPDAHFRDGRFWLYYAVSTFGARVSAIGLATARELNASSGATAWTDQGLVWKSSNATDYNAIDPNAFIDEADEADQDGSTWLTFGSFWSGIKLIRLDRATGKPAPGAVTLALASHPSGIEAPFLFRHGPWYFLFVSFDLCCKGAASTYNIRVGRAAKVTGPYLDSQGKPMLNGGGDLIDAGDTRWKGPGHNAIFTDHDTTFLVNHAYDAQNNGASTLWIRTLYWTPAGWPTLDPSKGTAVALASRPHAQVRHPRARYRNLLGRSFNGTGLPIPIDPP